MESRFHIVAALRSAWRWLIKPAGVWPNPPVPRDENAAGLGWSGDRRLVRPFKPLNASSGEIVASGQPPRRREKGE